MERKKWITVAVLTGLALVGQFCVSLVLNHPVYKLHFSDPVFKLIAFSDILETVLLVTAAVVFSVLARRNKANQRRFWTMMAVGSGVWALTWALWIWYEVINHGEVPTPSIADVILFMHLVPFMGALFALPHLNRKEGANTLLDFLMLASWWVYLYLFAVGPWQFVDLDVAQYTYEFDQLYIFENMVLLVGAFAIWVRCRNQWRLIYGALFMIHLVYAIISFVVNQYINTNNFSSGQLVQVVYDLPAAAFIWLGVYSLLHPAESTEELEDEVEDTKNPWMARITLVVLLVLPFMEYLTLRAGYSFPVEQFKLDVLRVAQVALTVVVFYRLLLLNRMLSRLLGESRAAYDTQQRLQEQLIQSEKMAAIGRLAAGAAHEINNPLTVIFGYSEILAKDDASTPEVRDMGDKIHQQARRTRDVVSQLMMFAKPSTGPHTLVDVNVVVENAVRMRRLDLEKDKFDLEFCKAEYLAKVKGSENQLLQVCIHLINNAVDAMRNQPQPHSLKITTKQLEGSVEVSFEDSGPGVVHPERIFDPFYTTKVVGQGIGLGLSAVFGIIREHNGTITCENNADRGAKFTIQIPIPQDDDVSETKHSE